MKKYILTSLLLLLLAVTVSGLDIKLPESVTPGGVITVFIEDIDDSGFIEAAFGTDDEIVSKSKAFRMKIAGIDVDIALLGVPSTLSPGIYTVTAVNPGGAIIKRRLTVNSKDFIREDIPLSRSMTSLRQSDDIRKAEQWRNLLMILTRVDTESIYEEQNLSRPVEPLRTSSFYGDRRTFQYDDGSTARSIHNGIDYSAEPGTPVYAAGRGRVVFSGERIISGLTVVIEHLPGVYSLYYHMNSLMVSESEQLSSGEQVGTVGATGLATGAHLHWEIRVAGVAVDPEPLMSGDIIDKDFILSMIEEQ